MPLSALDAVTALVVVDLQQGIAGHVSKEAHEYSIRNVFPRIAETGVTQEMVSLLENRSATA